MALLALAALAVAPAVRAETPIPDPPAGWVTDRAGFLSAGAAADLDRKLADYARDSHHQVLVYIDHTTGGVPIDDWAVKAFERWQVGRKGIDDGLVLFVMADDRQLRIEVGYGLEPTMTDTRASRIIREVVVPRIRAGDRDGAIRAGVDAIVATLGGGAEAGGQAAPAVGKPVPGRSVGIGLIVMLVLFVFLGRLAVTHPGLAWLLTTTIGSGRRGGSWGGGGWSGGVGWGGGGGGGFSGGGGRSGGGGASGSW
ncbi:MAG TPA: TPM domain-containing protein [Polyangia bacterium]|nr:TPM domain-containing protein [Polyangia bacterium]